MYIAMINTEHSSIRCLQDTSQYRKREEKFSLEEWHLSYKWLASAILEVHIGRCDLNELIHDSWKTNKLNKNWKQQHNIEISYSIVTSLVSALEIIL